MHLNKEQSSLPRLLVFPLLLLVSFGVFLLQRWPNLVLGMASCPLRDMTGLPCPTCGGTHAAVALAEGSWFSALSANPLVAFSALVLGIWSIYALAATLVASLRRSITLGPKEKRATRILAALLLSGTWIWEIIRL